MIDESGKSVGMVFLGIYIANIRFDRAGYAKAIEKAHGFWKSGKIRVVSNR